MRKIFCYSCLALSISLLFSCNYSNNKHGYNTNETYSSTNKFDDGLYQYGTTQEFEKTEVIDKNSNSESVIIPAKFYYFSYSETPYVEEILNNNIIDKLYIEECNDAITTVEFMNINNRYLDIWKNELDNVVDKIKSFLSDEMLSKFDESQASWQIYFETNPNIAVDIYTQKMGRGSIVHQLYADKSLHMLRQRTLELAEYYYILTGNFEFEFQE